MTKYEIARLIGLIGILQAQDVAPGVLDEVQALAQAPEIAVRLLFRVAPHDLSDMLTIELHGGPRWIFLHPDLWAAALRAEASQLLADFAERPELAAIATTLVETQLAGRMREILALRPDLSGHVTLGLLCSELAAITALGRWIGALPTSFGNSVSALHGHAARIAQRHAERPPHLPDLKVGMRPETLPDFHPDLRGLIDAPLFAAEVAYGLRPMPTARQKVQLLQAIQTDPGAFEASLPAAMAWHFSTHTP